MVDRAERLNAPTGAELTPEQRAVTEMIRLVNAERTRRGLPAFVAHDQVATAARAHAADMAAMKSMQHDGSDGSDGGDRLTRAGFDWWTWAENIGAGFYDPSVLFEAWMNSPGHRANILSDLRYIGVGAVASSDGVPYWALVLAS